VSGGHLISEGSKHWAFGRRRFHSLTVNQPIDNGEAVWIGVMQALNGRVVRAFNPDRKDTHWGAAN
jgi:hypothetical protein